MSTKLFDALKYNDARTANQALAHSTTGSAIVDLFGQIGSLRGDRASAVDLFRLAFKEDPLTALRVLFYARNPRGGMGERDTFRVILNDLAFKYPEAVTYNLASIPAFGRWDDLEALAYTLAEDAAFSYWAANIDIDGLAAKWAPREKSARKKLANKLRSYTDLSPREYRKLLANNTEVLETAMCNKDWDNIVFEHVPSQAMLKYRKAFWRNQEERFSAYIDAVKAGEKEIKATTLYPYEIVRKIGLGYYDTPKKDVVAEELWKALPDYMPEGDNTDVLVVCDTSGSMFSGYGMGIDPIHFSVSLALYTAERNKGHFGGHFFVFSDDSALVAVPSELDLHRRIERVAKAPWGMNTNLNAVFSRILDTAVRENLHVSELPGTVLVISDMQFDPSPGRDRWDQGAEVNQMDSIIDQYVVKGYPVPRLVWWNVNGALELNYPIKVNSNFETCIVSGASPAVLEAVLSGNIDPMIVVDRAVNSGKYDSIQLPPEFSL
jgi:hypothetical protein